MLREVKVLMIAKKSLFLDNLALSNGDRIEEKWVEKKTVLWTVWLGTKIHLKSKKSIKRNIHEKVTYQLTYKIAKHTSKAR